MTAWRGGWTALVTTAVSRCVLSIVGSLLLCSLVPWALGWHPTVVMTGSMEPRLHIGDVAVSRPVDGNDLRIGQVVLADDPDHPGRLRLHRLAAFRADGRLTLRGDANPADDSTPVARSAVRGVASLRVPYVGLPAVWLSQRRFADLAALSAALVALGVGAFAYRRDDGRPTGPAAPARPVHRVHLPRRRTGAVVLTVALVGSGLWTAAPAHAAFTRTTTGPASSWAAATYFTCKAAVTADSPYLFYQLGEASGTSAADSSGNLRTGTYSTSGVSYGATGPCSRDGATAVTLSGSGPNGGSGGYVATPLTTAFINPTVFSVEVWFKTTTTSGGRLIGLGNARTGASTSTDRQLYLDNSGHVVFGVKPGGTVKTVASAVTYNDGGWHLADATLSASGMALYVDGQQVAADSTVTAAQNYTGYWRVGYDSLAGWGSTTPTHYYLSGSVADAAVYTTALSATQVGAHYAAR